MLNHVLVRREKVESLSERECRPAQGAGLLDMLGAEIVGRDVADVEVVPVRARVAHVDQVSAGAVDFRQAIEYRSSRSDHFGRYRTVAGRTPAR